MSALISRRLFLVITGSAVVATSMHAEEGPVPSVLDHILLGCRDLEKGISFVESQTGVRAAFGGVHPGRGTWNALLSLGEGKYLEIIAPDPKQKGAVWHPQIAQLAEPQWIGWAAHVTDIEGLASRLRSAQLSFDGPLAGSRQRPSGKLLQWKTLTLKDDDGGLLPFFIEWSVDSVHPSRDAPQGCRLVRFELVTPDPDALRKHVAGLSLDAAVAQGNKRGLRVAVSGPKGQLELTS